jgi:hypothetical protein
MTAIVRPIDIAARATALALRRQPANVGVFPVSWVSADPFGEGSTSRVRGSIDTSDAGDSEYPAPPRPTARCAWIESANAFDRSSFHANG